MKKKSVLVLGILFFTLLSITSFSDLLELQGSSGTEYFINLSQNTECPWDDTMGCFINDNSKVPGLVWSGEYFYILNTSHLLKFYQNGSYETSYDVNKTAQKDIAYANDYLYITASGATGVPSDWIMKYDTSGNFITQKNVTPDGASKPEGITWNGSSLLMWDKLDDKFYEYDTSLDLVTTHTISGPLASCTSAGLASNGSYIYVFCYDGSGAVDNLIVELDADLGYTGTNWTAPTAAPYSIEYDNVSGEGFWMELELPSYKHWIANYSWVYQVTKFSDDTSSGNITFSEAGNSFLKNVTLPYNAYVTNFTIDLKGFGETSSIIYQPGSTGIDTRLEGALSGGPLQVYKNFGAGTSMTIGAYSTGIERGLIAINWSDAGLNIDNVSEIIDVVLMLYFQGKGGDVEPLANISIHQMLTCWEEGKEDNAYGNASYYANSTAGGRLWGGGVAGTDFNASWMNYTYLNTASTGYFNLSLTASIVNSMFQSDIDNCGFMLRYVVGENNAGLGADWNIVISSSDNSNASRTPRWFMNTTNYPTNLTIDVGDDAVLEYSNLSTFDGTINNLNLSPAAFNSWLGTNCPSGSCEVPINFTSNGTGKLQYSDIDLRYEYESTSPTWDSNTTNASSTTAFGGNVSWGVNVQDNLALGTAKLQTNDSGTWTDVRTVSLSGTSAEVNETYLISTSSKDDVVCGRYIVQDSSKNSNTSDETCFLMANALPTVSNVALNATPKTNDVANCTYSYADADSDSEGVSLYAWFINGVNVSAFQTLDLKVQGNKSDSLICSVNPFDGTGLGGWSNSSTVTVANSDPVVSVQISNPNNASDQHWFNVTARFTDADGTTDYYSSSLSQSLVNYGCGGVAAVPSALWLKYNTSNANEIEIDIVVNATTICYGMSNNVYINFTDASSSSVSTNTLNVVFPQHTPSFVQSLTDQHGFAGRSFEYDANCTDTDIVDTLTYYVNDTIVTINSGSGLITDTPSNADQGSHTINVSCDDSVNNVSQTFNYIINSYPAFDVVTADGSDGNTPTNEQENITFTATATDPDGDRWWLVVCDAPGIDVGDCNGTVLCNSSIANSGSQASCQYNTTGSPGVESVNWFSYAVDNNSLAYDVENGSSPFKINHLPPAPNSVNPWFGYNLTPLLEWVEGVDPDSDTAQDTVSTEFDIGTTLGGNDFYDGKIVSGSSCLIGDAGCIASSFAYDGTNNTYYVRMWSIDSHNFKNGTYYDWQYSVLNTLPNAYSINISPANPTILDTLECNYTFNDTDSDSEISGATNFSWWVQTGGAGSLVRNFSSNGSTFDGFSKDDVIMCSVLVVDEHGLEDEYAKNSSNITIQNILPTIPSIDYPEDYHNYSSLSVDLNASGSTDADGDTITYYFYVNGALNSTSTTNSSYNASADGTFTLNVSAFDGANHSSNSSTITFSLDTSAPTWTDNTTNASTTTSYGGNVSWGINLSDETGLDSAFLEVNGSLDGGCDWRNYSAVIRLGGVKSIILNETNVTWNVRNDYVCGKYWFNDTLGHINESAMTCFLVANTAPSVSSIDLKPDGPSSLDWLNCSSYTFSDTDSDAESGSTYKWFKDDVLQGGLTTQNISYTNTANDEVWLCEITPKDGTTFGNPVNSTSETIGSSAPSIAVLSDDSSSASPTNVSNNVSFSVEWSDPDAGQDQSIYVCSGSGITSAGCGGGDTHYCNVTNSSDSTILCNYSAQQADSTTTTYYAKVCDETGLCSGASSGSFDVNHAPTIVDSTLTQTVYTNSVITCSQSGGADSDSDTISYEYQFNKTGTTLQSWSSTSTYSCSGAGCNKADVVWCWIKATDQHNYYLVSNYKSNSTNILNTVPVLNNQVLNDSTAYTTDVLNCSADYADLDNDTESTKNYTWFKTAVLISAQTSSTLDLSAVSPSVGDTILCMVRTNDAEDYSIWYNTSTASVIGTQPTITTPTIIPVLPQTDSSLDCSWTITDPDPGETLTANVTWYLNDAQNTTENNIACSEGIVCNTTADISTGLKQNDRWNCSVLAWDGKYNSTTKYTNVTVRNYVPTVSSVEVYPKPAGVADELNCQYVFSDGDSDANQSAYRWFRNKTLLSGQTASTLPSAYTIYQSNISCEVRPYDGFDYGTRANSTTLQIGDITAPRVWSLASDKASYTSDEDATITVNCSEIESGISLVNFSYKRGATFQTPATMSFSSGNTYTYTLSLSVASYNITAVSCKDGAGNIGTNSSSITFSVTSPPTPPSGGGGGGGGGSLPKCNETTELWDTALRKCVPKIAINESLYNITLNVCFENLLEGCPAFISRPWLVKEFWDKSSVVSRLRFEANKPLQSCVFLENNTAFTDWSCEIIANTTAMVLVKQTRINKLSWDIHNKIRFLDTTKQTHYFDITLNVINLGVSIGVETTSENGKTERIGIKILVLAIITIFGISGFWLWKRGFFRKLYKRIKPLL